MAIASASALFTALSDENKQFFDQERERLHRQILSSVSHDLKTPIASIIGALEVFERMKHKLPEEKQQTLIRVALQETYRLDNLITNILDMARLENGMVKAKREVININFMLRDCLTHLSKLLATNTVQVTNDPTFTDVKTDPILLSRAISLVLDNAVKYGGINSVIYIQVGHSDDKLGFISIRDTGAGIAAEKMEAIFAKYTRYASGDQLNTGAGLGLVIGRETMRLLGGDLTVQNHPQGGAHFTLTFATE